MDLIKQSNMLIKPKIFRLISTALIFTIGMFMSVNTIGQLTCPNNVSTPSGCPTKVNIPLAYPLTTAQASESCANPSDEGCATFTFTNLPYEGDDNCPVELCFIPSQGCGVAQGNICVYETDANGNCKLISTGNGERVCLTLYTTTYQITICRPGKGPVSLNQISISTCCTPSIKCPSDISLECDDDAGIRKWLASATAEICDEGGSISNNYDRNKFTGCNKTGTQTVTFSIPDGESFVTCQAKITLVDTKPPVFNGTLSNITVECGDKIPDLPNISASDACGDVKMSAISGLAVGICPVKEIQSRCLIATDACENEARICQEVTIKDTIPPVFNITPADVTVQCENNVPPPPTITATDACDGTVYVKAASSITNVDPNCPNRFQIERTWMAEDACGNKATMSQIITVNDTRPPVLSGIPADVTVCGENNIPAVARVSAVDNCDGSVPPQFSEKKDATKCSTAYTLTRTWVAKDKCGNSSSGSQIITVEIPPVGGWAKASKTEFCNVYNEKVNLWVEGNKGDVLKWQIDEDCNGNWVDIPNSKYNSIWVTPPAPENEDDCCVKYRAIVGCDIACRPVPSVPVRLTVDVPAKGGRVLYNGYSSKTLCPGQCINLELKGYVGRIVAWQMSDAYSPGWMDIPYSQGETSLKVCYPSRTTYYRVLICATCGICGPPYYTAYSSSFKLSPASMCGMWNDPMALTSNNEITLSKVYPSPAKDKITLQADGLTEGVATIDVLDITGKVVHREKLPVNNGFNEINMTINHLANGLYVLRLTDSKGQNATIKVSKM